MEQAKRAMAVLFELEPTISMPQVRRAITLETRIGMTR
jgi:hypothetical protein